MKGLDLYSMYQLCDRDTLPKGMDGRGGRSKSLISVYIGKGLETSGSVFCTPSIQALVFINQTLDL